MKTIKAILNNEITKLNQLLPEQIEKVAENERTEYPTGSGVWYNNPSGAVIAENATDKPSKYHKWDGGEWIVDTSRKQELIAALSLAVDKRTAEPLAAGLDFNSSNFPLAGDAYADNMAAATAYTIGQGTGGLDLNTSDGSYAHVDDIPALISKGLKVVIELKKAAIDEKAALQSKTTAELIELLNP